jgi:ActR/RegA family two-component response regulator
MTRFAPAVFVLERRPRFEAELKRRLTSRRVLVRPCRSPADLAALAARMPGSVAVVDLAFGMAECLHLLGDLLGARTPIFPVVVGSRESAELEWPVRELGAAAFVCETIGSAELADLCGRMLS